MADAEERQRKSLYLTEMWELAELLTGHQSIPGYTDPVLGAARRDIDRWWPKLKDRGDRIQLIERAIEQTDKGDRHAPWLYFRKVVNGLIAERPPAARSVESKASTIRIPSGLANQWRDEGRPTVMGETHCHVHGWYPMRDLEKHANCSYEGES